MHHGVLFRSCARFDQGEFADWVATVPANDLHHYELLDGFIVREPPASWPHGEIEGRIVIRLGNFVEATRSGRVLGSSQGFDLPSGDTVEPDVSFVSAQRWRAGRSIDPRASGFLRLVPDLVFEILSPSTAAIDRVQKKGIYERNGVREYVLVDPVSKTLQCFVLESRRFAAGRVLVATDDYESAALPGFAVSVGELFPAD